MNFIYLAHLSICLSSYSFFFCSFHSFLCTRTILTLFTVEWMATIKWKKSMRAEEREKETETVCCLRQRQCVLNEVLIPIFIQWPAVCVRFLTLCMLSVSIWPLSLVTLLPFLFPFMHTHTYIFFALDCAHILILPEAYRKHFSQWIVCVLFDLSMENHKQISSSKHFHS